MPSVDGGFCLVVRGHKSPELQATTLLWGKDKGTLSYQIKFKDSLRYLELRSEGDSSPDTKAKAASVLPYVPHKP